MALLVMMRHGQSMWNAKNIFTGWVDIPLSKKGVAEAIEGGKKIAHIPFDVIFTSALSRAENTAMLAMSEHDQDRIPVVVHPGKGKMDTWGKIYSEQSLAETIPVYRSSDLNERMYGAMQGMNKDAMREKFGADQVHVWRRSYDVAPPEGESLKMTAERAIPYFQKEVMPWLEQGKNVFIAAHGNSLRSIVMHLDGLGPEEVVKLEIATGDPLTYDYSGGTFNRK